MTNPKRKAENELKLSLGNSLEWETLDNLPTIPGLDSRTFEELIGTDLTNVLPWTPDSSGTPLTSFTQETTSFSQTQVPQQQQANPRNFIQEITDRMRFLTADIERLGTEQKRIATPVPKEVIASFESSYRELKVRMQEEHARLTTVLDSVLLEPTEMQVALQLFDQLNIMVIQTDLLLQELHNIMHKPNAIPVAALVITSQPLPTSVFKGKALEGPIIVQLLTGSKTEYISCNGIKAEVIPHPAHKAKATKPIRVTNAEGEFGRDRVLRIDGISFPDGSNNLPVLLKFSTKVTLREQSDMNGKSVSLNVESKPSKPLIVKTNEKQWEKAEGLLLTESAFGDNREITWERYANFFYQSYLIATRQSPENIERPLSPYDFEYIRTQKFNSNKLVNLEQAEAFWGWIGPMLHKIRYTKRIGPMFVSGYICGFLTGNEVTELIQSQEVGTFIVRFSERQAAGLVISYQSADTSGLTKVRHYQIKQDDIYASTKTLADFLGDYHDLHKIISIKYDGMSRNVTILEKDRALKEFYTKRSNANGRDGYEDEIVVLSKDLEGTAL